MPQRPLSNAQEMTGTRQTARRKTDLAETFRLVVGAGLLSLLLAGCGGSNGVKATLETRMASPTEPGTLVVHAQVRGDQSNLIYKWFSARGQCAPQESDSPVTIYKYGTGVTADRISLEIWRGRIRMAQSQIEVQLSERERTAAQAMPAVQIEITEVPPYDPEGHSQSRHHIAGKVNGQVDPNWLVVIYERRSVGVWEIQPNIYEKHALRSDNSWSTWTHSGATYAVVVVRPQYAAPLLTDIIPSVGGDIFARAVFEGEKE